MNSITKKKKILFSMVVLCQIFGTQCSNTLKGSSNYPEKATKFLLADRSTLLMRGHSTSFTDGYMDGCETGQHAAGDSTSMYLKNAELAKLSPDYSLGWEQGRSFCYDHMHNLIKHSGSNNPSDYQSKEAIELEKQRIWSELKK